MTKPLLICLLMVKNEADNILDTLNSMKQLSKIFYILDTGSTDDTKDIINKFCEDNEIKLHMFNRPFDDFSTSRNFLLSKVCKSKFLIFLDAGDKIEHPKILLDILNKYKKQKTISMFVCKCHLYNDITVGSNNVFNRICIIRNNGLIKYKYPIHEQLYGKGLVCTDILETDFRIVQDKINDNKTLKRIKEYDIPTLKKLLKISLLNGHINFLYNHIIIFIVLINKKNI